MHPDDAVIMTVIVIVVVVAVAVVECADSGTCHHSVYGFHTHLIAPVL